MEILMPDRLITAEQNAEISGCSTKTVRRYADLSPAQQPSSFRRPREAARLI
jgi:hypothetical protein